MKNEPVDEKETPKQNRLNFVDEKKKGPKAPALVPMHKLSSIKRDQLYMGDWPMAAVGCANLSKKF